MTFEKIVVTQIVIAVVLWQYHRIKLVAIVSSSSNRNVGVGV